MRGLWLTTLAVAATGCQMFAGTGDFSTTCPAGQVADPNGVCGVPTSCAAGQVLINGTCHESVCGDKVTDPSRGEECDPPDGLHCDDQCQLHVCGDGTKDPGEACDDGNTNDGDYCSADCSKQTGKCGDGKVQDNEACDDGNTNDGDYCSADCKHKTGSCGDGKTQDNEACDYVGDDYCSNDCKISHGFCGDSIQQDNEACDDGNTDDGDYCSADCKKVTGRCGDGTVQSNEVCDNGPGGAGCFACRSTYAGPMLDVGSMMVCGIDHAGAARCWLLSKDVPGAMQLDVAQYLQAPPTGQFRRIATAGLNACAIRDTGRVVCWGADLPATMQFGPYANTPIPSPFGSFLQVSLVADGMPSQVAEGCGILQNGTLDCFKDLSGAPVNPEPNGKFIDVSAFCALRSDRTVKCWGGMNAAQMSPPASRFRQVSAGRTFDCGIDESGSIECWGATQAGEPPGKFVDVEAGNGSACALGDDGAVRCWGNITSAPAGPFAQISVGEIACGVKVDGTATCWGPGSFKLPADFP